jgi:hypothetical protein
MSDDQAGQKEPPHAPETKLGPPIEFEFRRVPVQFFRVGPQRELSIRERYEQQLMLDVHSVGPAGPRELIGKVRIVQENGGLAEAYWDRPEGVDDGHGLLELSWQEREHVRGALLKLMAGLNGMDRDDARLLINRHAGHHHHTRGLSLHCSCDDEVILTYWSGVPPRDRSKLSCTECGKRGVTLSPARRTEENP